MCQEPLYERKKSFYRTGRTDKGDAICPALKIVCVCGGGGKNPYVSIIMCKLKPSFQFLIWDVKLVLSQYFLCSANW